MGISLRSDVCARWHTLMICPHVGDVSFDARVQEVAAGSSHLGISLSYWIRNLRGGPCRPYMYPDPHTYFPEPLQHPWMSFSDYIVASSLSYLLTAIYDKEKLSLHPVCLFSRTFDNSVVSRLLSVDPKPLHCNTDSAPKDISGWEPLPH